MKVVTFALLFAALISTSCGRPSHSDAELQSLITGNWQTSASFETTADGTRIVSKSTGTTAFNADGSLKTESQTRMTITVSEGSVPIDFHAVVHGTWAIVDQSLKTTRISEEIKGSNEASERFITSEGMMKMRSESPTQFVSRFKRVSPGMIVTRDRDGLQTMYTRDR